MIYSHTETKAERVAKHAALEIEALEALLAEAEARVWYTAVSVGLVAFLIGFLLGSELVLRKLAEYLN